MDLIYLPQDLSEPIRHILEWHLNSYMPEHEFNIRVNRILEQYFQKNLVNGNVQVKRSDLYYINECVSNATNNIDEIEIDKDTVWKIYDWVIKERKK